MNTSANATENATNCAANLFTFFFILISSLEMWDVDASKIFLFHWAYYNPTKILVNTFIKLILIYFYFFNVYLIVIPNG